MPVNARQHGSALILMPAAVLVLLVLGVIAVDSAVEYLGHRQLADFAAGAADTAAAQALDRGAFYQGAVSIDQTKAQLVVDDLRRTASTGGMRILTAVATVSDDGHRVTVTSTAEVHEVFGPAVGGHRVVDITASSSATLHEVADR